MAKKTSEEAGAEPPAAESHATPRHVLVAGIAGACALGVGAGLWARPAADEQRAPTPAAKVAATAKPRGKIEIVLTDPLGGTAAATPKVTAAIAGPAVSAELVEPPAEGEPEPLAPVRRPEGLMRVQQVEAPEAPLLERETAKAEAAKLEKAKLAKADTARREKLKLEKAKLEKAKLEKARKKQPDLKVAKAEPKETKLAVADTGAEMDVAEAKAPGRLSRLKTAIAKPFKSHPKAETELAKAEPRPAKPKKSDETRLAKLDEPKETKAKSGSKRCVSSDPGAAIVCADPTLAAADRQLTRAYREAEAAGVPASQLRSQQQRWLAARAAAAREAPWAVHDVYLARIAELNDLTRDAREGY